MRTLLARLGALAMLCLSSALVAQAPPNILFVLADDLGCESLGCYGDPSAPPTPALDALAASGVRFDCAIVNPACSPTRAALLTGRYGIRTGTTYTVIPGQPGALGPDPAETTLPQAVAPAGYATALIGKWHLGARYGLLTPNNYGWPWFSGVLDPGVPDAYAWVEVTNGATAPVTTYITTRLVDEALQWIGAQRQPWLLQLALTAPHQPFQAPPPHLHTQNLAGLSPATSPLAFQRAMVQAMDTEIGRLLTSLPAAMRANTLVIFLSDNGTDPAAVRAPVSPRRVKGTLYDRGSRVPMIAAGAGVLGAGRAIASVVSGVDVFATVHDLCGAPPLPNAAARPLDGVSLRPLLQGTAQRVRDHAYIDMSISAEGGGCAIRDERYELLRIQTILPEHLELYDLQADPLETVDLLAAPLPPAVDAVYQRFLARLDAIRPDGWCESYGAGCVGSLGVPRLRLQTQPTVGDNFFFHIDNAPLSLSFAAFGFSRTAWQGGALPFDLRAIGMPGCSLWVSSEVCLPIGLDNFGVIPIPAFPSYDGYEFFLQGFTLDPVNALGVTASSPLRCVLGS